MIDIPFEIWAFGIIVSFSLAAIGLIVNPRMHIMVMSTAFFLAIFAFIPSNLIMGYSPSSIDGAISHYDIESSTGQVLINSVTAHSRGERLSNTSSALTNDEIDCITVYLGRSGTLPTGTLIRIGVMDTSTTMIKQFGAMNVTALLTSSVTPYQFCLPIGDSYTFTDTETFGIKWNDGDGSNTLTTRVDANNPFDGGNTEHVHATGSSWISNSGQDIIMKATLRDSTGEVKPILYEFNQTIRFTFFSIAILILTASMILVVKEP